MKRLIGKTLMVAAVGIIFCLPAHASMILSLSDGTVTVNVPLVPGNLITFSGAVGDYTVSLTAGAANVPGSVTGTLSLTQLNVMRISGSGNALTVTVTAFDYTLPPGGVAGAMFMDSSQSGTYLNILPGGDQANIMAQFYADPTNSGALANASALLNAFGGTGVGTTDSTPTQNNPTNPWNRGAGPYSLTIVASINIPSANTNVGAVQQTATMVVRAPEPGSLVLLGSGLLVIAGLARKFRAR